ncbi:crotonobetainyl-CoA:carnitine CoA-transferase CaiB-like acyl-CoA transferase [Mycolicibacterium iranicum]|uniref:Crotonobetainyl-CoA:carnitine CoA-transferase CaiB-like acyl-CoA transferase n=1 Tax=Mycolicibacterium iranicum TaxID=912594 RepID=A0A839QAL5_MYCIR|nr:CoA transferase [Mycolicibacterium iranicum]MBB2992657.1 crotonobetainyl-CoA:carnitine CoA-transferase CaiB-like acyl-CoA transferase [Mycolicibacterium iranicum]
MAEGALSTSLRVLDLSLGDADAVGRILADLGADVLKIEPPAGSPSRGATPSVAGVGIPFLLGNANKRCAQLDPGEPRDRDRLLELASDADIVIDCGNPGGATAFGTSARELAARFAHLVVLSVSDFGATGPRASWQATDAVLYAMSSALSRTGPTSGTPVLPPDGVASGTAAAQAAWATMVAYYDRLRCGIGEFIDFSRFDGVVQALDPPFGTEGQAAVGLKSPGQLWRGRPRNQQIYPIFECRDGHVRICLLSPKQWRGMRAWLGEPAEFAGPEFDTIAARYAASQALNTAMAALFAAQTMADLVAEGQARGVPVAAVLTPSEALSAGHFEQVGALHEERLSPAASITVPVGPFVVDGLHRGYRAAPPPAGADLAEWAPRPSTGAPRGEQDSRPFAGLRILDLGVIVAGGELGRLFADLGAEVIKIESPSYPDGLRQAPPGAQLSRSWALAHRNEYSLGLDLRNAAGAEVFADLVAGADAVFANFKPGTLAALGFSYDRLRELNPALVLAESSAFGDRGPWSARMGYGPLVRAASGVARLWTSPDAEPGAFFDATTVFPDHIVGRLTAIAALAVLIRRVHEGGARGGHVHVSQAEAAIGQLAGAYAVESARAAGIPVHGIDSDHAVDAVLPCAGDDEWCVVSIRIPSHRVALAGLLGRAELPVDRAGLISAIAEWTAAQDKSAVAESLQRRGVPAAPMLRAVDLLTDPQVLHRDLFSEMTHPLLTDAIPAETAPARFDRIARAEMRPAPMPGEHTYEICQKVLGMSTAHVDGLIRDGALFASHTTTAHQHEK